MTSLDRFSRYHHIWRKDREDAMRKYDALNDENFIPDCHHRELIFFFFFFFFYRFIQGSPLLSEFESQIIFYRDLELEINSEPEYITVGALALFTG